MAFLFKVGDVYSISGKGIVVTGNILEGEIMLNGAVTIIRENKTSLNSTVTCIETFDKLLDKATSGDNVGLLLSGIEKTDVERNCIIVDIDTLNALSDVELEKLRKNNFVNTAASDNKSIFTIAAGIGRSKEQEEPNIPLTMDEIIKCNLIIHSASVATGAMGIIPIGPADTLMITPTQIAMIISLGAVFHIEVSENLAKSILGGLALSVAGRAVAATILSFIPVVGWIVKGGTAAALTEAIGWIAVAHFHDIQKNHSKFAGKKEGYTEASAEYEKKLRRQADEFIQKQKVHKSEMAEFSQLVDELTKMIIELSTGENADSPDTAEKLHIFEGLIESLKKLDQEE